MLPVGMVGGGGGGGREKGGKEDGGKEGVLSGGHKTKVPLWLQSKIKLPPYPRNNILT